MSYEHKSIIFVCFPNICCGLSIIRSSLSNIWRRNFVIFCGEMVIRCNICIICCGLSVIFLAFSIICCGLSIIWNRYIILWWNGYTLYYFWWRFTAAKFTIRNFYNPSSQNCKPNNFLKSSSILTLMSLNSAFKHVSLLRGMFEMNCPLARYPRGAR